MWRPIKGDEIKNGTAVNAFGKGDDSPYSISTIIAVFDEGNVRLARPMAYASDFCNSKEPMIYTEVYETTITKLLAVGLVWKDSRGGLRSYMVGAA